MPSSRELRAIVSAIIDNDGSSSIAGELLSVIDGLSDYVCTCDHCSEWCNCDEAISVDGEEWCSGCVESDAYFWQSDAEHHSEPEPEPEPDDHGIPDYHDTEIKIEEDRLKMPTVLGVELETYQTRIDSAGEKFREMRDEWSDAFKFERDGSLDEEYGVEIAAQPYTLAEIRSESESPWKEAVEWSRCNKAKSWDAGQGYGMHISLNGAALQPCHRARIVRFFNDNRQLCEKLAGRPESRWAKFVKKDKLSSEAKPTDKYQAAANRGDRIEVRIFRGTLNWERFVRNCEFVDSVRVYTETSGCSDRALSESAFREWMTRPENRTAYPLLATELGYSRKRKPTEATAEV